MEMADSLANLDLGGFADGVEEAELTLSVRLMVEDSMAWELLLDYLWGLRMVHVVLALAVMYIDVDGRL